jgi:hypothetical protein
LSEDDFDKLLAGKLEITQDEKPVAKRSVKSKENGKAEKDSKPSKIRPAKIPVKKKTERLQF